MSGPVPGIRFHYPVRTDKDIEIAYATETRADVCASLRMIQAELRNVSRVRESLESAANDLEINALLYPLGLSVCPIGPDGTIMSPDHWLAHREQMAVEFILQRAVKNGFLPGIIAGEWLHCCTVFIKGVRTQQFISTDVDAATYFDGVFNWVAKWPADFITDGPPGDDCGKWIWAVEACAKRVMKQDEKPPTGKEEPKLLTPSATTKKANEAFSMNSFEINAVDYGDPRVFRRFIEATATNGKTVKVEIDRHGRPIFGTGVPRGEIVAEYQAPDADMEGKTEVGENKKETNMPTPSIATGLLGHAKLAEINDVDPERLRKRLERWRSENAKGWIEVGESERGPNDPKYLYRPDAVQSVIASLKTKEERRMKMSGQRPATK